MSESEKTNPAFSRNASAKVDMKDEDWKMHLPLNNIILPVKKEQKDPGVVSSKNLKKKEPTIVPLVAIPCSEATLSLIAVVDGQVFLNLLPNQALFT